MSPLCNEFGLIVNLQLFAHTVTNAIKIHHLCLKFSNKSYGNNENFIKLRAKFFIKLMEGYCKVRTAWIKSENENKLLVCTH